MTALYKPYSLITYGDMMKLIIWIRFSGRLCCSGKTQHRLELIVKQSANIWIEMVEQQATMFWPTKYVVIECWVIFERPLRSLNRGLHLMKCHHVASDKLVDACHRAVTAQSVTLCQHDSHNMWWHLVCYLLTHCGVLEGTVVIPLLEQKKCWI